MYLSRKACRARQREAEHARANRQEIARALSHEQITRRDLFKWGIFTASGLLACKHGLSPFASSAYARGIPTGSPPSNIGSARKFTQALPRPDVLKPSPLTRVSAADMAGPHGHHHGARKKRKRGGHAHRH
jgi:hypothetical protein